MKTTTFVAVMAILLLLSCQKTTRTATDETTISLTAPSGQTVASSLRSLNQRTASVLAKVFSTNQDVAITHIAYLPVQKGFAATVYFEFEDGRTGSFGLLSANQTKDLRIHFPMMAAHEEEQLANAAAAYMLVCRGSCQCRATLSYNSNTGLSGDCGCDNCSGTLYVSY